jgi:hypothetical protein
MPLENRQEEGRSSVKLVAEQPFGYIHTSAGSNPLFTRAVNILTESN